MKKLLTALSLMLCVAATAQTPDIAAMRESIRGKCVTVKYSYKSTGDTPLVMNGTVTVQDSCFVLKGDGIEVYCNGVTRWFVDREAKEVYVDSFGGVDAVIADPAGYQQYLSGLKLSERKEAAADKPLSFFEFPTKGLGSDWLVTDLRD